VIEKRATLKTLAARLGLSVSAVSRALKESPDIGRDTIILVKRAAEEVGYVPDYRGVKLRTGKSFTIVFLKAFFPQQDVPEMDVGFEVQGIIEELTGTPYQLQVLAWNPLKDDATALLSRIISGRLADGVLMENTQPYDPRARLLAENNVPFVTFGRTELLVEHPYVDGDNEQAAFDATRFLIARNHRRIALAGPDARFTYGLQRRRGYLRALEAAGLPFEPELVMDGAGGARGYRALMPSFVAMPSPPTGFVCCSEPGALGIMAGMRDAGRVFGEDYELVSRDGLHVHEYLTPPLPTCFLDLRIAVKMCCNFLLRRIDGAPIGELQRVLPCELIVPPMANGRFGPKHGV
jgi:LacI family transcriptional regulator